MPQVGKALPLLLPAAIYSTCRCRSLRRAKLYSSIASGLGCMEAEMHILIIHPPPSLSRKYSVQKRETGYSKPVHYYCPASVYSRAITAVVPAVDSLTIVVVVII